jgi:esterase/lipase superfamily enzyme
MASNSYVVTVRQPSKEGYTNKTRYFPGCDYLLAAGGFNKNPPAYAAVQPPLFWKALQQDLLALKSKGPVYLIVLVHGFTITYDQCVAEAALYGQNIVNAGIPAIVVALSWPGDPPDFDIDGYNVPLNYFAAHSQARASASSVLEFLDMLNVLRHGFGAGWLTTCAVCHSMGNYLLGEVTNASLSRTTPFDRTPYFDRTLLVAADLPAIDLDKSDGRGFGLNALAGQITVYWSLGDDVLPLAVAALDDASQPNPARLGFTGPASWPLMSPQHVAVDCSLVVN